MSGEKAGKDLLLKIDTGGSTFVNMGALQAKTYTFNNEEIDVTNHDSDQWKTLLAAGIRSMAISGNGIHNGSVSTLNAAEDACKDGTLTAFQIVDADSGRTYEATFKVISFERSGEHNGAQTYTLSLSSTGAVVVS